MMAEVVDPDETNWRRAFQWLAAIELADHHPDVASATGAFRMERLKSLVILFDLLPRADLGRLREVVIAWNRAFGEQAKVTLEELRRVARLTLSVREHGSSDDDVWQRARRLSRWQSDDGKLLESPRVSPAVSDADRRSCTEGIAAWLRELQENPQWRSIPGVIPGESDRPMNDVYVELLAIEEEEVLSTDESHATGGFRHRVRRPSEHTPPITVEAMISRTLERCVVVGDPGSGKSTLVRWLVWAAFERRLADFDLAIAVKLSTYAAALLDHETLTPLEYFFRSLGLSPSDASNAARGLGQSARESHRWLLLFDGWDEVPVAQRATVKAHLLNVEPAFVTLITSRPSGMPRQLVERQQVACYRIVGLTPLLAQELTANVLGQSVPTETCSAIWNRIQADPRLLEMSSNPFLLGMLVRALARSAVGVRGTRSEVYRHLTAWVREHYEHVRGTKAALTARHLDGLAELSLRLLNDPSLPRYLFSRRELESSLNGLDAAPVLDSRFVTRPVPQFDEFALLHATIQEFLAAEHAARCSLEEQQTFLERTFQSASRFILLEFFVGLNRTTSLLARQAAESWWASKDRFGQVAQRLVRLAVSGCWPVDELNQSIRKTLWAVISNEAELEACQAAVEAFAELDPVDLIQRARQSPPSSWAMNCILTSVPPAIAKQERLHELLAAEWAEFEGLSPAFDPVEDISAELQRRLQHWAAPPEDLNEAVRLAGATQEESLLPLLVAIAKADTLHGVAREEAVSSIGRIGGRAAVPVMVDLLLSGNAVSDVMARMAGIIFTQPSSHRLRLDPRGRDRILRRLATVAATSPRVENYLTALIGFPIRDGAEVIAELACGPDVPVGVRRKAIGVLVSVSDRDLLTRLISRINTEPLELLGDWLSLAWQRSLSIPLDWLQQRIRRTRNRLERDKYLKVYCRVLSLENSPSQPPPTKFLDQLIVRSMKLQNDENDLARALTGALNGVADARRVFLSQKTLELALKSLTWMVAGQVVLTMPQTLLAIAIIRHFHERKAGTLLRQFLDQLREQSASFAEDQRARAVAECLAELAPAELLTSPIDCPVVTAVLRTRSIKQGWVVFFDRILDVEGLCLASSSKAEAPRTTMSGPAELQDLLNELPDQARRVLESYLWMTRISRRCQPHDSLTAIHEVARSCFEKSDDSPASEFLHERFKTFPKLGTWVRQLNRIEKKFARRADAKALLSSLGLFRRR